MESGSFPFHRIELDRSTVHFDNDVVADRESLSCSFADPLVVKNGSKIRFRMDAGMPVPESSISIRAKSSLMFVRILIVPRVSIFLD